MRITMPGTPETLSIEGVHIRPDEFGAFDVPDYHAHELVKVHGGAYAPEAPAKASAVSSDAEAELKTSTKASSRKK